MKNGFTLVELAIVLMIVGLLIGGILKGQELIQNARINRFITDEKAIAAAYNSYIDRYNAIPGDDPQGLNRFPNCGTFGMCSSGNGDGLIQELTESTLVFLVASNLLTYDHFGSPKGSLNCLWSSAMNAFWNVHTPVNITLFGQNNRVWLNMIDGYDHPVFSPQKMAHIDTKMDDGNGTTGELLGINGGTGNCTNPANYNAYPAGAGDYDANETAATCRPFFRLN